MKLLPSLSDDLAAWIQRQPVFFTGSAPTHGPHINVSPKGQAESHFAVLGPNEVAYIDRTGSGCETIAHAYDNGRLCLMFMSFGPSPRILRLFCRARVVEWDQPAFPDLVRRVARGKRDAFDAARAVILCSVWQVQTSCGYGVPRVKTALYAAPDEQAAADSASSQPAASQQRSVGQEDNTTGDQHQTVLDELCVFEERPTMDSWAATKVHDNMLFEYQSRNNAASLDGLPGLRTARRSIGQTLWLADARARASRILAERDAIAAGFCLAILFILAARAVSAF